MNEFEDEILKGVCADKLVLGKDLYKMSATKALNHFFDNDNWQSGDDGDWQYVGSIDPQVAFAELAILHDVLCKAQRIIDIYAIGHPTFAAQGWLVMYEDLYLEKTK